MLPYFLQKNHFLLITAFVARNGNLLLLLTFDDGETHRLLLPFSFCPSVCLFLSVFLIKSDLHAQTLSLSHSLSLTLSLSLSHSFSHSSSLIHSLFHAHSDLARSASLSTDHCHLLLFTCLPLHYSSSSPLLLLLSPSS